MPLRRDGLVSAPPAWLCRGLAAVLILAVAVGRLAYLLFDCPLDLAQDEAHYWDWSRHLDWSYYSKGPLVAWLIRGSCELFGPLSVQLSGTLMPAIRLPAVVCGAMLLLSLYVLTVQITGRDSLALAFVAVLSAMPHFSAVSMLMTIDAPYTCCWGWALVLAHRAIFRGSWWAWPTAGLVAGIGILAKYTMVLFLPSLGLFLLTSAEHRRLLLRPGFWALAAAAALSCIPIVIWNAQHDWVTFKHVAALAGLLKPVADEFAVAAGPRVHWLGPLVFVRDQFALLMGYWFVVWAMAMARHNPLVESDTGLRYLWWMSAPVFGVFLLFGFKTGGGEMNWAVTAYLSGGVLSAIWLSDLLAAQAGWTRRLSYGLLASFVGIGLLLSVAAHRADWFHPLLARIVGPPRNDFDAPLRRLDPTCRLRGWRELAAEVDRQREQLARSEGIEPVLAGVSWALPGELGVYCAGHPPVYSVGLVSNDRHSQYDLWPGPIDNPQPFLGRTFLIVGAVGTNVTAGFEHVEPTQLFVHEENGQRVAVHFLTIARNFKGFPRPEGRKSF